MTRPLFSKVEAIGLEDDARCREMVSIALSKIEAAEAIIGRLLTFEDDHGEKLALKPLREVWSELQLIIEMVRALLAS